MKLPIAILIALPLISTSCKKDKDQDGDNGCIERVYVGKNDHTINNADISAVNKLFADNKIDNRNFRYWKYRADSLQRQYAPYEKVGTKHVRVNEFVNNLRVLDYDVIFNFTNEVLTYRSSMPVNVANQNTFARLSLARLRKMFLEDVEKNPPFPRGNYTDSCLCAELGYYIIKGNGTNADKVVKAWLVTGKNTAFSPRAIYNDDGSRISYQSSDIIPMIPINP